MERRFLLSSWIRLTLCEGIGSATQRKLLREFGLPEQIFALPHHEIARVAGDRKARLLLDNRADKKIDTALQWAAQDGNHIITLADAAYPQHLLEIADPPVLLYAKGDISLLQAPAIAVVGARSATAQGEENARNFAKALADAGLKIISGLALGIDVAAHEGALLSSGSSAIAVIGTGADRVYPAAHRDMAHRIVQQGVVVSEFPLGTPPQAHNFPKRNRIIAGLSRGVLVVEAAESSGSLITARLAAEMGREVFAVPGSIHSPLSRGCHQLIKQGATLVETVSDILQEFPAAISLFASPPVSQPSEISHPAKRQDEQQTLTAHPLDGQIDHALGFDPVDVDTLVQRSGVAPDILYARLLCWELEGRVARLPGNRYQRL